MIERLAADHERALRLRSDSYRVGSSAACVVAAQLKAQTIATPLYGKLGSVISAATPL